MIDSIKPNEWKRYLAAAIIGLIIFAVIDVIPTTVQSIKGEFGGKVIQKAEAELLASAFAEKQAGLSVEESRAVHQTDKILNGYLMKEELYKTYYKEYDSRFPTDTYQVEVKFENGSNGFVYVHMQNGAVTSWNLNLPASPILEETASEQAIDFLVSQGFRTVELSGGESSANGLNWSWSAAPSGYKIGNSQLNVNLTIASIDGEPVVTMYKPAFKAPDSYIEYVTKQDTLANLLTMLGYFLMTIVLGILAIIYAILCRKFTSFKYGIVLTIIYFVVYAITNLNMLDGIRASFGESPDSDLTIAITAIFSIVLGIPMAASIYISLIAGDGLWKSMGRDLWPRFKQAGYGDYVWRSMVLSYQFTIILIGAQSVIFLLLKYVIGTWNTSDVSQSPYNMSALWLMPVLAWMAAIGEEAVYRFFGVGLFRKWFKNTFAACLIPTLVWALGHVMYPFYPATTRLIELMIVGLAFCYIFIKYGYITAMFTHAIFNSVSVGYSIFMVGSALDIASAIFFIVLPVPIAYVIRYLHNKKGKKPPVTTDPPLMQQ